MNTNFHKARTCAAFSRGLTARNFVDNSEDEFEDRCIPQNWDDFEEEDPYESEPVENDPYEDFDLDDAPDESDLPDELWNDSDWE